MADVIWTNAALQDLDAIADYIALDNLQAARKLVERIFLHTGQLAAHPESGSRPPEMRRSRYRQIVEPPCRIFYRQDGPRILVLHVLRGEMRLKKGRIAGRDERAG